MRLLISVITLLVLLALPQLTYSQANIHISTEKVQDESGKYFLMHTVEKGHTLYAISKAYNVSIDELKKYNSGIENGLQLGQKIKIPIKQNSVVPVTSIEKLIAPKGFVYHQVQKGETLYRIMFKYQVKMDVLKKYNPKLSTNIHSGDWILIPTPQTQKQEIVESKYDSLVVYKIKFWDNYYRLKKKTGLDQKQLEQLNPKLKEFGVQRGLEILVPYNKDNVAIPEYKPVVLDSVARVVETEIQTMDSVDCKSLHFNRHTYKIGILIPLFSQLEPKIRIDNDYVIKELSEYPSFRFIDFYQGALLAFDSLSKLGMKIQLFVWDTKANVKTMDSICNLDQFASLDLLIGPFYSKNTKIARKYASKNRIKLIDLFSHSFLPADTKTQHFIIESNTQSKYNALAKYVHDSLQNYQITILHRKRASELKIIEMYKKAFNGSGNYIDSNKVQYLAYQEGGLKTVLNNLSMTKTNILINLVEDEARISNFLRQVEIRNKKKHNIVVIANNKVWSKYKTLELTYLNNLKYTFTSDYYINYKDSNIVIPFNQKYFKTNNRMPNKLAYLGYDVAWYFGNALYYYGINFSSCLSKFHFQTLHNKFDFYKIREGVYRNRHTSIIQYDKFQEKVKY